MVNLLPLAEGETISTVLALPQDEAEWGNVHIMFATARGTVRRNSMDAFTNIPTAGKIAMKFGVAEDGDVDDGDESQQNSGDCLIAVELLTEQDDVLLATRNGKAIRFLSTDVREFQSRSSMGVRGVRLLGDDRVISMSILRRVGTNQEEREAYLKNPSWREREGDGRLSDERYAEIADAEQFLLTVTVNGYGKRSSTYEYRRTRRGGQGITNIVTSDRNGGVIASFPVTPGEALMLVTDQGKVIRTTVGDIRIAGRNTQGVTIFKIGNNEKVVSVAKIDESDEEEIEIDGGDEIDPVPDATIGEDLASGEEEPDSE